MPDVDDGAVAGEIGEVLECRKAELEQEQVLARLRVATGEAVIRLQEAGARKGVNRIVWSASLLARGQRVGAEMTVADIGNRKRMAIFSRHHSPETNAACLTLSVTRQRAIATLPPNRLEEFVNKGVPTATGCRPLREAKAKELARASKASRGVPPWEPIPQEKLKADPAEIRGRQLNQAMRILKKLGSLTLEEAERLLLILMTLFSMAPRCTTRRLSEWVDEMNSEPEATDRVLDMLDALPQMCRRMNLAPGTDRLQLADKACSFVARLLQAISSWRKAEREAG